MEARVDVACTQRAGYRAFSDFQLSHIRIQSDARAMNPARYPSSFTIARATAPATHLAMFPRPLRLLLLLLVSAACVSPPLQAAKPNKAEVRDAGIDVAVDATDAKPGKHDDKPNRKDARSSDDAGVVEARQLARLRDRLNVPDDAEWAVIAERINKVEEVRRTIATIAIGGRGVGGKTKRANGSANPEYDALRAAVGDQYPDAEIKARLARLREAYARREAELRDAQVALRSVLSLRQEAVAVMAGLLPP
jgi:hypothetical protein